MITKADAERAAQLMRDVAEKLRKLQDILEPHLDEVAYYEEGMYAVTFRDEFGSVFGDDDYYVEGAFTILDVAGKEPCFDPYSYGIDDGMC